MRSGTKVALGLLLPLAMSACSMLQTQGDSEWIGYKETGKASYYASQHQGQKTASGERYDGSLKTAAHRKLPFGSRVKVTNTDNGKSVIARVNDRGPHTRGYIIDLSKSAFSSIANLSAGVVPVKIEVVE